MRRSFPNFIKIHPGVDVALSSGAPVVALESTVITHGLPFPENLQTAQKMEIEVRSTGSVPATIGIIKGQIRVGLEQDQLEMLAEGDNLHKISARDYSSAVVRGWSGGTTVAGTLLVAHLTGIRVFATGGIGGVHREPGYDISADLPRLAVSPVLVVCSGAKSILDLDATLEHLETYSIPVIGYQTDDFPAFFSTSSGFKTSGRVDTPEQAAALALAHWDLGMRSAVLLVVPPPATSALPGEAIEAVIQEALLEARRSGARGQAVTPILLDTVRRLTGGESLRTNIDLLLNNAKIAGQVAGFLAGSV